MEKDEIKNYLFAYASIVLNKTPYSSNQFECPCCHNKRSFAIRDDRFICFNPVCELSSKGGDIFDLVEILNPILKEREFPEKMDFLEAEIHSNKLLPSPAKNEFNKEGTKRTFQKPSRKYESYFIERNEELLKHEEILKQLLFRGITLETIKKYEIGFISATKDLDTKKNLTPNFIIIPFPESIHFIAWNYNHKKNNFSKYYESGKPEIFNAEIIGNTRRPIFICEGIFDTLTILQEGFEAVCLCSADKTQTLIDYLKEHRPANNLILLLDDDEAGKEAEGKLISAFQEMNIIYFKCNTIEFISNTLKHSFKDINEIITYRKTLKGLLHSSLEKTEEKANDNFFELQSKIQFAKTKKKNKS